MQPGRTDSYSSNQCLRTGRKAIYLARPDGSRTLQMVVPESFDTQAWACSRQRALSLLECKVIELSLPD